MALWICDDCTTAYAVGLTRCPRCHGTSFHEEGTMPKISRAAGASHATRSDEPEEPARVAAEGEHGPERVWEPGDSPILPPAPDESYPPDAVPLDETSDEEGGEEPSPGNSSETSPEKQPTSSEPSSPGPRKRARKTANRSPKAPTGGSSAPSTDGDPTVDTSEPDTETGE